MREGPFAAPAGEPLSHSIQKKLIPQPADKPCNNHVTSSKVDLSQSLEVLPQSRVRSHPNGNDVLGSHAANSSYTPTGQSFER